MFHFFIPLVPLTLAGALVFKKKTLAYGLPVLLTLLQVWSSKPSPLFFFTGGSLILGVVLARRWQRFWGCSLWALAAYAGAVILVYELISNFGIWILAGCIREDAPLYPFTVYGLIQCYRASWLYSASHFLRDIPLAMIFSKGFLFASKFDLANFPWHLKHESTR